MAGRLILFAVLLLFLTGAGPILVDTEQTGLAVAWRDDVVQFNPETGEEATLGTLSNEEALELLRQMFRDWQELKIGEVPAVNFTVVEGDGIGSVDADNLNDHFSYCPPLETCPSEDPPFVLGSARTGVSPILFDHDGAITDLIHGNGAKRSIIGFAGPRVVERINGLLVITEGQAVLNGLFIDCPDGAASNDPCKTPEVDKEDFEGAIFHEIGHFIGLDHTQVNLASAVKVLSGDDAEIEAVTTMFPLLVDGTAQRTPHFDDRISAALLYPSAEFTASFCTVSGTVFQADTTTELQGVNVVARRLDNPLLEATSYVSGQLYTGSFANCAAPVGDYSIGGLSPGVSYSLEIQKISGAFTGGSSIEPCDPPQSGFEAASVTGTFSCKEGGELIVSGTEGSTRIITTKGAGVVEESSSGGCSLLRVP